MEAAKSSDTRRWRLGPVEQVPLGEGRCFVIRRISVAVFRTRSGGVYATQPRCTHRGGPLADGVTGGETLVCPLHGYKFSLTTGAALGHQCGALKTYPVEVEDDGTMVLTLEARQPGKTP